MKEINDPTISINKEHIHCCPDQAEEHGASRHLVLTPLIIWIKFIQSYQILSTSIRSVIQLREYISLMHVLFVCAGYFLCLYAEQFFPRKMNFYNSSIVRALHVQCISYFSFGCFIAHFCTYFLSIVFFFICLGFFIPFEFFTHMETYQ